MSIMCFLRQTLNKFVFLIILTWSGVTSLSKILPKKGETPTYSFECSPNLSNYLNITFEVKQYHKGLFLSYRPQAECSISQFCNTKCTHSIFRTIDRSTRGLLAKQLKKFPKSPSIYGQPVLTFAERAVVVFEWTLTELRFNIIKNLLWLFF